MDADAPVTDRYRRYVLGLLVVVYVFNFIDRQILTILLEPIKRDLDLSDGALGFLSGLAFALFYSTLGVPIARWADRGVRRSIIAGALFLWSGMTALTGLAQSFWQLALARVGVGVGEAGCSPPAHALISDYFPADRRATALSIYALGIPIGSAIGVLTGGWVNEFFGWRVAFAVVGVPGLLLAAVVRWTLREPPRGLADGRAPEPAPAGESALLVFRFMLRLPSFRHLSLAGALHAFYGYGAAAFIPAFLIRVHGFETGELATWLALLIAVFGALGTYLGGRVGDWLARRGDPRWYMWVPAVATLATVPFVLGFYLWPSGYVALLFHVPTSIASAMWLGPTFATTQNLAPLRMRATASALLLLIVNLIGLGMGPWAVGALSDALAVGLGVEAIRYALLGVVLAGSLWSAVHYFLAARTLRADLAGT